MLCFEVSLFYGGLITEGLIIFLTSLNYSLKNLHKTLMKSIIFRLCLYFLVFLFVGTSSNDSVVLCIDYFPLVLGFLVLGSFIFF